MKPKFSFHSGYSIRLLQLLCNSSSFLVLLLFCGGVEGLSRPSLESPCGNTDLRGTIGTITSPNYPLPYSYEVICEWKIHSPENSITRIGVVDLDLQEDYPCHKPRCCTHQWLLVPRSNGRETKILCGRNTTEKTIVLTQTLTIIKYFSSNGRRGGRGFKIIYSVEYKPCKPEKFRCNNGRCIGNVSVCNGVDECGDGSDELHCYHHSSRYEFFLPRKITDINGHPIEHSASAGVVCSEGKVPCPLSPDHCYSKEKDLCDKEFDCPKGEDEVGCDPACPKQIACASGDGCYYPVQRCNSIRSCRDNSDETGCPPEPCVPLQFTCLNGACVAGSALCDGDDDCGDFSDEENCSKSSFMTAAIMGLLSCIFLFCIGLSCLYRVYAARLRASASFAHQLEPEPMDDDFMYREPPPAYSVAVGESGTASYPPPDLVDRYLDTDQVQAPNRTPRQNRRRQRPIGNTETTSTSRSRPRPSVTFTSVANPSAPRFPAVQCHPKNADINKAIPEVNFESVIELLGFPDDIPCSRSCPQSCPQSRSQACPPACSQLNTLRIESLCSTPSLSPSRESVTSCTSLDDHEDLVRSCRP